MSTFDFDDSDIVPSARRPRHQAATRPSNRPSQSGASTKPKKSTTKPKKATLSRAHTLFFDQRVFADHFAPFEQRKHWQQLEEQSKTFQRKSVCDLPGIG